MNKEHWFGSCTVLDEPKLEFGNGFHVDIKHGIGLYGALDAVKGPRQTTISAGIIGKSSDVRLLEDWLRRCETHIRRKKKSRLKHLFAPFPGFNQKIAFHSNLYTPRSLSRIIRDTEIARAQAIGTVEDRNKSLANLFAKQLEFLGTECQADIVLVAVPEEVLEAQSALRKQLHRSSGSLPAALSSEVLDFHDALKIVSINQRVPIQLISPPTFGGKMPPNLFGFKRKAVQDEATRAWNLFTAIYYKAGYIPYRIPETNSTERSCYVGVSFYEQPMLNEVGASITQIFDNRGDGIVLRGEKASFDKHDRRPYLDAESARIVIKSALEAYEDVHGHRPARVVVHKSSSFRKVEAAAMSDEIEQAGIRDYRLLAVTNTSIRLTRNGAYPPLRGTFLPLGEQRGLLYTKGSVPFYETWPGLYIPSPVLVESGIPGLPPNTEDCNELLMLTKMNWNDSNIDNRLPVTISAAQKVSRVVRHQNAESAAFPKYAFYM